MAGKNTAAARKPAPELEPKDDPMMWSVRDTNANGDELRRHEPVKGFRYDIGSTAFLKMPQHHAVKFLSDKAFEVLDENDELVEPVPQKAALKAGEKVPRLGVSETVAEYSELTDDSLLRRSQVRAGGERFNAKTKRDTLIDFLTGPEKPRLVRGRQTADSLDLSDADSKALGAEPLDPEELDDILPRASLLEGK